MPPPQLIFIHGPTAVGKLTVARELARLTGFRLFHNHLVVDALTAVFEFGSEPFVRLREPMWLAVLHDAAVAGISLIFTFTPEATVSPIFIDEALAAFEGAGGEVRFVALTSAVEIQDARIADDSRAAFGKLRSVEIQRDLRYRKLMDYRALPDHGLTIDTGVTRPHDAAQRIVDHFALSASKASPA
jgi:hypothetical protein